MIAYQIKGSVFGHDVHAFHSDSHQAENAENLDDARLYPQIIGTSFGIDLFLGNEQGGKTHQQDESDGVSCDETYENKRQPSVLTWR